MAKATTKKETDNIFYNSQQTHKVWHKFSNWLIKTYGKDLHGEWQKHVITHPDTGKKHTLKFRNFNDHELSRRIVGYEVMCKVEKYIKRCCPEIKIVRCDDDVHAGSDLLLIPHPKMGISVMFIPQCTGTQNRFFLYSNHFTMLMRELKSMSYVYTESL